MTPHDLREELALAGPNPVDEIVVTHGRKVALGVIGWICLDYLGARTLHVDPS
jgi:hypothetical protein